MGPSKEKLDALTARMKRLGIKRSDIEEKFIKASGSGGQKVNKTASAVFLRHAPTGITAKCQKTRSQHLNRFLALRSLLERLEPTLTGAPPPKTAEAHKRKKQKSRRRRKARKKHSDQSLSEDRRL